MKQCVISYILMRHTHVNFMHMCINGYTCVHWIYAYYTLYFGSDICELHCMVG